jgi:LysM repeat protein
MIHTAPPALDWRYIAIAGLLVGVGYLLLFRPVKTVMLPASKIAIPRQDYFPPLPQPPRVPTPVTPPAVTATPVESWPVYIVQPQDTLWSISAQCYGDGARYPLLITANKLGSKRITAGMKLRVPGGKIPSAAQ